MLTTAIHPVTANVRFGLSEFSPFAVRPAQVLAKQEQGNSSLFLIKEGERFFTAVPAGEDQQADLQAAVGVSSKASVEEAAFVLGFPEVFFR